MTDEIPEGSAAGLTYYVVYSEDLWLALPDDRREYCKKVWIEKAKSTTAEYVVLMLVPDPLFPQGEHETRYIGWQTKLEKTDAPMYHMELYAFFEVSTGFWSKLGYGARQLSLVGYINQARKAGAHRYRINCGTEIIAQGRV